MVDSLCQQVTHDPASQEVSVALCPSRKYATHKKTTHGILGLRDQTTIPYVPTHATSRCTNAEMSPKMAMKKVAEIASENQCDTFGRL